ncbi:LLM class flavin-dependent oxidoreductase [Nakamurella silvestris]|nr:LLM class flavin-dependent oxidoreductase [Nakamurella silvestris]
MRIGVVILPQFSHREAAARWKHVEDMGFAHGWTYDHLAWRTLADEPWHATVPFLANAALATTTLRLGTFVTSPNFRHPVTLAKDLMTLDDLSDGRIIAGIGAGGTGWDSAVFGEDELTGKQRVDRLEEFLTLTDTLLTQDSTTWRGEHYTAVDARMIPGCVQRPRLPIAVAANGPRMMRIAAGYDGWITTGFGAPGDTVDQYWEGLAGLTRKFDSIVGDAPVARYMSLDSAPVFSLSSVDCFTDAVGRAAALGFTDAIIHWPRPSGEYAGREEVLEQVGGLIRADGTVAV